MLFGSIWLLKISVMQASCARGASTYTMASISTCLFINGSHAGPCSSLHSLPLLLLVGLLSYITTGSSLSDRRMECVRDNMGFQEDGLTWGSSSPLAQRDNCGRKSDWRVSLNPFCTSENCRFLKPSRWICTLCASWTSSRAHSRKWIYAKEK